MFRDKGNDRCRHAVLVVVTVDALVDDDALVDVLVDDDDLLVDNDVLLLDASLRRVDRDVR